ncbi:MAG: hypothetical protein WBP45_04230 [Daejeonella sp.]
MNLKKTILVLSLAALTIEGCKKDKASTAAPKLAFDKITLADIKEMEPKMTAEKIVGTSAAGILLKPGAVILYKTNAGNYGKLKVVSNNGSLTIDILTYKTGSSDLNKPGLKINPTGTCDLDTGISPSDTNINDFHWESINNDQNLAPQNTAIFYHYSN